MTTQVQTNVTFPGQEQPNVFLQCQCMGDIAIYSERTMNRYQVLLDTVMPLVNPDFNQDVSSCTPDNLALAWLATDEYSIDGNESRGIDKSLRLGILVSSLEWSFLERQVRMAVSNTGM